MSIPEPLYSMCRQFVVVEPYAGDDGYGAGVFGTATTYRARVVHKPRVILNQMGNEVLSATSIILTEDVVLDPRDRVTLSTADVYSTEHVTPKIISIKHIPDAVSGGLSHAVIYV